MEMVWIFRGDWIVSKIVFLRISVVSVCGRVRYYFGE